MFDNLNQKLDQNSKTWRDRVKDFWLPNENNAYQPHSLKFRRLAFYATSAVLMKIVVIVFVVLLPVTAWLTPDVLTAESKKVISLTNQLRASLDLAPLQESITLNQAAYSKVEDMFLGQYFAHISPEGKRASTWLKSLGYSYHVAGENLALGFSSAEDVMIAWENSPTHYANLVDPMYTEIGVSMANGLYTEVDTTLAAQYFAKPRAVVTSAETVPVTSVTVKPSETNQVPEKKIEITEIKTNSTPKNVVTEQEVQATPVNDLKNANLVPVDNLIVSAASEDVVEENIVIDNSVLVEQDQLEPLISPVIITPVDNFLTNKKQINLEIKAPQTEKVFVYDNSILLLTQNKDQNLENISFNLNLTEGQHEIYVKASRASEVVFSDKYHYQIDLTAPSVDLEKTKIIIDQPEAKDEVLVKVDAYLSDDVISANVAFGQKQIALTENSTGHWIAYATFSTTEASEMLDPVILPNLSISDQAGNQNIVDLALDQVQPVKTSVIEQYFFLRKNQIAQSTTLFNISIIYYRIFALLLIIALALNIFVHIKRQNYKVIGSSVLFLSLLFLLIIF